MKHQDVVRKIEDMVSYLPNPVAVRYDAVIGCRVQIGGVPMAVSDGTILFLNKIAWNAFEVEHEDLVKHIAEQGMKLQTNLDTMDLISYREAMIKVKK